MKEEVKPGFYPRVFDALVRKLRERHGQPPPDPRGLLDQFVWSFLLWDAQADDAERALKRIATAVVDFNELRVCLPDEIVSMLGVRYPRAPERAVRLKTSLHDVYLREHAVDFDHLKDKNKRVARQYLDSLDGCPPFVAARMMAVGLGGHAAPLDDRLLARLAGAGVFDEGTALDRAEGLLERHIKAEDALETHLLVMLGCEDGGGVKAVKPARPASQRPRAPRGAARKPARKD